MRACSNQDMRATRTHACIGASWQGERVAALSTGTKRAGVHRFAVKERMQTLRNLLQVIFKRLPGREE
jgi:hypothetical protein